MFFGSIDNLFVSRVIFISFINFSCIGFIFIGIFYWSLNIAIEFASPIIYNCIVKFYFFVTNINGFQMDKVKLNNEKSDDFICTNGICPILFFKSGDEMT